MNEWKKVKLGDCISTKKGFAFKSALYTNCGVPVVRVSDFTLDSVADNDLVYYPHAEKDRYDEYVLNEGDVLIQTVGSWQYNPNSVVGKVVRVPYYHKGSLLNQNIVKIIPNNGYNNAFIFYRLKCRDFAGHVLGEARGAANQASITLDTIKRFSFDCPLLSTQQRIATILSRYDSLIENYQKQIKLLEEAAQRLYKEWFIDLRFPGHENTNIIDGVPEGWEKKSITDVLEIKYGKDHKLLKEGTIPVYGTGGIMRYVEKSLFTGESVLIPRKGSLNNIMLVGGTFWTIDTMFYSIPKENNVAKIVYFYLKGVDMYSFNIGAAVPSMTVNILSGMKLLVPNEDVKNKFETIASKYFIRMHSLQSQLRLLTEARDRLLPKLMSGEIEI